MKKFVKLGAVILTMLIMVSSLSVGSVYSNDGKLVLDKYYKDSFYLKFFKKKDGSKTLYLMQKIPHYSEYDKTENPSQYNWCGYAAMNSAVKGIIGKKAKLKDFANASIRAKYTKGYNDDIYIHHLYYLSYDKVKFDGTFIKKHLKFENGTINSSGKFFKNVVTTVLKNKGVVISPYANYFGYPGHFYVIVGLKIAIDKNNNKEYSYLLRDVALKKEKSTFFDRVQEIEYFYSETMGNSNNYNIKPVINILP